MCGSIGARTLPLYTMCVSGHGFTLVARAAGTPSGKVDGAVIKSGRAVQIESLQHWRGLASLVFRPQTIIVMTIQRFVLFVLRIVSRSFKYSLERRVTRM
jgi:hypothetical protein